MYITNNTGPRALLCGTQLKTSFHEEVCPFIVYDNVGFLILYAEIFVISNDAVHCQSLSNVQTGSIPVLPMFTVV